MNYMAIWLGGWYNRIKGGWKTVGASGVGAFASNDDWIPTDVGPQNAMRLSAYFSCIRLLSETMGSLSFQLLDNANNVVDDHPVYDLIRYPSGMQTGDSFVSAMAANMTMYGNSICHIVRFESTGRVKRLDFHERERWAVEFDDAGRPKFSLDGESVPYDDVLHWAGFGMSGYWGLPTLAVGAEAMSMQIESNRSAGRTFSSGLRAGGFFELPENRQAFSNEQLGKWKEELVKFSKPQNTGAWMPMLPGMKAVASSSFRIDPVTAELLQSRYFGIEEICRFMGVPPPLIGHTDKASSWASSIENLNQFLVDYRLRPMAIRFENQIALKLLGRNERSKLNAKFNMGSLLRGDIEKRFASYKIGRDIGAYSANDVRAKEKMPRIEGGDDYTPLSQRSADNGRQADPN